MKLEIAYGPAFSPPAPVLPVGLAAPGSSRSVVVPMIVDTGADCSVVPVALVRALALPQVDVATLKGVGGPISRARVYAASVRIGAAETVAELVAFGDETILGRDLLRRMVVRLDGPKGRMAVTVRRERGA